MGEEDLEKLIELARLLPPGVFQAVLKLVSAIVDDMGLKPPDADPDV